MHKNHFVAQNVWFISSVFKKIIPNNTTPTFQEVGGVTQPHIFCRWHKNFSWNRVNHHKPDWFLLWWYFYLFTYHCFQLKWTRTSTHGLTHSAHGDILRVIFSLLWFTKFLMVSIQRAESVLDKNINIWRFKITVGYIFPKYVHCDMRILDVKIGALFCFLNGFGTAVPLFIY